MHYPLTQEEMFLPHESYGKQYVSCESTAPFIITSVIRKFLSTGQPVQSINTTLCLKFYVFYIFLEHHHPSVNISQAGNTCCSPV